jgi:hypothetical protein
MILSLLWQDIKVDFPFEPPDDFELALVGGVGVFA